MPCLYVCCICRNVVPARRQGYGPFDRTDQVAPDDEMDEDTQSSPRDGSTPRAGETSADTSIDMPQSPASIPSPSSLWAMTELNSYMRSNEPAPPAPDPSPRSPRRSVGSHSSSSQYGRRRYSSVGGSGSYGSDGMGRPRDDVRTILQLMRRAEWLAIMKGGPEGVSQRDIYIYILSHTRSQL